MPAGVRKLLCVSSNYFNVKYLNLDCSVALAWPILVKQCERMMVGRWRHMAAGHAHHVGHHEAGVALTGHCGSHFM